MKIHLSRFVCLDVISNLQRLHQEAHRAAQSGAELCVFPESFLHGYSREVDPEVVRQHFISVSSENPQTAFIFGSFTEDRKNRMTVWQSGKELARYDKVHLFAPNHEGDLWDPGTSYAAVRIADWTLGLINCNDIRFPEQARALRLQAQCDALVAVAWWPWRRDHLWSTLLRARAVENGVFTVGCCISASESSEEIFAGAGNHVFDPIGDPVSTADDHTYILDRARFDSVIVDPRKAFVDIQDVQIF